MKTDIISETINSIKKFLNFCFDISSDFSNEEFIFETIDKEKARNLLLRIVNNIIGLRKAIKSGTLKYNEDSFYKMLVEIINLNTQFHTSENSKYENSKYEKDLQDRLMFNLAELNKEIIEWNSKHLEQIMTLKQAKEKYNSFLKEGLKYFEY